MKSEFNRKFEQVPWARFVLSLITPEFRDNPELFSPMLQFVANLISYSPDLPIYSSGKTEIDGTDFRFVALRDSSGISWLEEGKWTDHGDFSQLACNLKLEVKRVWDANCARLVTTASGDIVKSGTFKTWAWEGSSSQTIKVWAPKAAVEAGNESVEWWQGKNCYFPASRQTGFWKLSDADQLLERLALELSQLLKRAITVHSHFYTLNRQVSDRVPEVEERISRSNKDDSVVKGADSLTVWRSEVTARARSFYEEIDLVFPPPLKVAFFSLAEMEESKRNAEHFKARLTAAFARDLEEGANRASQSFVAEQYEPISNRLGNLGYDSPDRF